MDAAPSITPPRQVRHPEGTKAGLAPGPGRAEVGFPGMAVGLVKPGPHQAIHVVARVVSAAAAVIPAFWTRELSPQEVAGLAPGHMPGSVTAGM